MEWKNIYRGFLMGTSDVVPGVSGGTIAVILGIYNQLIAAINGFFSREWKKHLLFLLPLVIGMGGAIFSLSHVMKWLLENYERPTYFLFIGLIIGILPYLFRESNAIHTFKWSHYVFVLIGIGLISLMKVSPAEGEIITDRSILMYIKLFLSGVLASAAMILPGISGSFVLLVIGMYKTIIEAVSNIEITVILVVGTGIAIGIVVMSKIIHFFLTRFRNLTFAMIIGLVIGSIYVIFPGWATGKTEVITCVFVFIVGLLFATLLGKVEH